VIMWRCRCSGGDGDDLCGVCVAWFVVVVVVVVECMNWQGLSLLSNDVCITLDMH
jgi:hypothetical protein